MTDTTFRDAHQSLFATRLRTFDLLRIAPHQAHALPQMLSVECWGGATFDVALRFLHEDPWDRLAALRERMPNQCLQMLLRGRNLLGYERYPEPVVRAFVQEAVAAGIDVFRIFDALNNVEPMRVAIETTLRGGRGRGGRALLHGRPLRPGRDDLHARLLPAARRAARGRPASHILAIKDMAGCCARRRRGRSSARLRERFDQPVHLHTHDTAGGQLATYLAALDAGVDAVDGAVGPDGGDDEPAVAVEHRQPRPTTRSAPRRCRSRPCSSSSPTGRRCGRCTRRSSRGLRAPTGRLYRHEIPGGQLSNLRQQAIGARARATASRRWSWPTRAPTTLLGQHRQGDADEQGRGRPRAVRRLGRDRLGRAARAARRTSTCPAPCSGSCAGELGEPAGGLPQPFAARALRAEGAEAQADGATARDGLAELADERLATAGRARRTALSELIFPGPAKDRAQALERYGDVSVIPTAGVLLRPARRRRS